MTAHKVAIYYAWSRPEEVGAPLGVIENRFPTLFEVRRMLYPRYQELADPRCDQGVDGFLDHIMRRNFAAFVEQTSVQTGAPVLELERLQADGRPLLLDDAQFQGLDTLIIISFDSIRTRQTPSAAELQAVRSFLATPGRLLVVAPHHDIGHAEGLTAAQSRQLQEAHFHHHGDRTLPPEQRFGGFARALLAGLGVPVENQYGLHPAAEADGAPAPLELEPALDRIGLLQGVTTFNLHPHLPNLARLGDAAEKLDVLARQRIDLSAPAHPFTRSGRSTFDALLQSRREAFTGTLLVTDATLWSSTAGGVDSLRRFWANVVGRARPA